MTQEWRPILVLDFDGVLHSYTSGWKGADVIPDPPVEGMAGFLAEATDVFEVHILSSRTSQPGGVQAMQSWLAQHVHPGIMAQLTFPPQKPAAFLTIDDRAVCFTGAWPDIAELRAFKPWNKQ